MAILRNGSSTIVQPVGSQTKPTVLTRSVLALRKVFFTAQDVSDPQKLYGILHALQQNFQIALRPLAQNPTLGGNVLQGVVFTGGQTLTLAHGLGRAFVGFVCIDAQGSDWSGHRVALPAGVSPTQMIAIQSTNAGTYSFLVY